MASDAPTRIAAPRSIARAIFGAGFLAHQIGEPARQLAFVGLGESAIEHVGNHQTEHVVAEEFEPLVAAGAIARALERRDVGQCALQHVGLDEAIADAAFKSAGATLAAARRLLRLGVLGGAALTLDDPGRDGVGFDDLGFSVGRGGRFAN